MILYCKTQSAKIAKVQYISTTTQRILLKTMTLWRRFCSFIRIFVCRLPFLFSSTGTYSKTISMKYPRKMPQSMEYNVSGLIRSEIYRKIFLHYSRISTSYSTCVLIRCFVHDWICCVKHRSLHEYIVRKGLQSRSPFYNQKPYRRSHSQYISTQCATCGSLAFVSGCISLASPRP